jgi:hypothetical protein
MANKRTSPNGTDNFDIEMVSGFKGYVSSIDATIADARVLTRGSQNVYQKISGTIGNRPGRKLYDSALDGTIAKVNSGKVWNTSLGAVFPVRCSNGLLQFSSAITGTQTWYTLLSGLTLTRFIFATYWDNTDKKDKLLSVNGDTSKVFEWAGGVALFVSYAGNVITLDRNAALAGFASAGTVTINGVDYTYSGISGSTLTGTTDATAAPANAVTFSKIITTTSFTSGPGSTYACDFIRVVDNQLYLGSYTSQQVFLSKNTDYTDFSFSTPRLTGEGDTLLLDASARGVGVSGGAAHIFYGTSSLAKITFSQITVGSTLSEQVDIAKVPLGLSCAAQGQEFIDALADNIIYLDQANQLRSFGNFRNLFVAKSVLLSQAVQTELSEENFSLGQLKVVSDQRGDLIYITAPSSGKTYLYQERTALDSVGNVVAERVWQPPQIWGFTGVDAVGGAAVGFSNANPQFYYIWDTGQYADDSPSGQLNYISIALFSYQNGGRRQGKMEFDKVYWEGYMTPNSNVYAAIYIDYQGSTTILNPTVNDGTSPLVAGQTLFSGVVPPSLGDASLGDNPLGDGVNTQPDDQALVPKFRVITSVPLSQCFEWATMIYSNNAGARWELLALGVNAVLASAEAVEIVK